jgi:hypothetical protein
MENGGDQKHLFPGNCPVCFHDEDTIPGLMDQDQSRLVAMCRQRGWISLVLLPANELYHPHNRLNRGFRLIEFYVVAALIGEQLLALGRQLEEFGLARLPIRLWIQSSRQNDQWQIAKGLYGARLGQTLRYAHSFVEVSLDEARGHRESGMSLPDLRRQSRLEAKGPRQQAYQAYTRR